MVWNDKGILLSVVDQLVLGHHIVVVESAGEISTRFGEDVGAGSLIIEAKLVESGVMRVSISTGLDNLSLAAVLLGIL